MTECNENTVTPQPEELQPDKSQTNELQAEEPQVNEAQVDEAQVNEAQADEAQVNEPPTYASPINESPADVLQTKSRWYIVHTYSGFEQRVEATIKEMIRNNQAQDLIDEVIVPTERVIELGKGGTRRTTTRKFYPGYIMVRMTMTDFSWHLVQSIPKVTGFVGGKNRPVPMKNSEAEHILSLMETRQEQPRPKFSFDRGEEVRVMDGPFGGFNGIVEDVNNDKGKLRVSVSIFGRPTPVELDFVQVSKS